MGKKTKKDKNSIEEGLDIQMNLADDLAARNPWFRALYKKFPDRFINEAFDLFKGIDYQEYYKEYDQSFHEIWGDIFPTFPYPVLQLKDLSKRPSELILTIDLNYTKDEIMFRVEQFVEMGLKKYREKRESKYQRKVPEKWRDYLEIWDLKDGRQPWVKDSRGVPFLQKSLNKISLPWTYEEIAKYKYPDTRTREKLGKAVDKVKKQYKAAVKLIIGKKYNIRELNDLKCIIDNSNRTVKLCDECSDKPSCKDPCPSLLKELATIEVKQQHKIIDSLNSVDIDEFHTKSKKAPTAEKQFKKLK
jgi:hypothetical protein